MTGSVSMILLLGLSSALLIFTQALYVEEQIEIIKDICEDYEVTLTDSVICRILSRPADSHQSDSEESINLGVKRAQGARPHQRPGTFVRFGRKKRSVASWIRPGRSGMAAEEKRGVPSYIRPGRSPFRGFYANNMIDECEKMNILLEKLDQLMNHPDDSSTVKQLPEDAMDKPE